MIYILTGAIGSGKTTQLENWVKKKESVAGILMPVFEGERHMYSIHSDKLVPVEIHEDGSSDDVVKIGRYNFSGKVFDWGNKEIIAGFKDNNTIIIDEIGPLELNGKGLALSLIKILNDIVKLKRKDLVLVVREGFVDRVAEYFGIDNYVVAQSVNELAGMVSGGINGN